MALLQFPGIFGIMKYEYQPLVDRTRVFRLIKLLPPVKSFLPIFPEPLHVEIIEAGLDSPSLIDYETLSYTWGVSAGAQPDRPVIVETHGERRLLWIHRPLEEALRSITANQVTIRPLFVDQICIDQSQTPEKEVLVPLMGEIYARCSRVIVWLGTSTKISDQFFDCTRQLNEQGVMSRLIGPNKHHYMEIYDAVMSPDQGVELTGVKREDRDDLLALIGIFKDRFSPESLIEVLQRPWFNRLWIIQEACLARDVTFLLGSKTLCFECFRCSCAFFPLYSGNWIRSEDKVVSQAKIKRIDLAYKLLKSFNRLFQERKAIHELGQRQTYYEVMLKYNVNDEGDKINCTKPEDRLFAVLGLADRNEVYGRIAVRYDDHEGDTTQSEGVYIDFASLAVPQNLDVLLFTQSARSRLNLPSWVPDWSANLKLPHGYLSLTRPVHTAGLLTPEMPPEANKLTRQLFVSGTFVGRISHVGECVIVQDVVRPFLQQVDYPSLRRFYEEAEKILSGAGNMPSCPLPQYTEADFRRRAAIRLSDFGLTTKYMADRYGYSLETAYIKLESFYEQASIWAQKLIDTRETVDSYSLSRIMETVNIAPYYWIPASETDIVCLCATDPLAAAKTWLRGLLDFTIDVVAVCISSARVTWTAKWLQFMRSIRGLEFPNQHSSAPDRYEALGKVGLNPEVFTGREMADYTDFVYRNIGQRLYMTDGGYVGVGPENIHVGDSVVVLYGGTVPHILRPQRLPNDQAKDMLYAYLGETYCDGVMEGQLLQSGRESLRFRIQ